MKRPLFAILSVVSLVLSVATAVLWVRSYWADDMVYWRRATTPRDQRAILMGSSRGRQFAELDNDRWLVNVKLEDGISVESKEPSLGADWSGFFQEMSKSGSTSHFIGLWYHTERYTSHSGHYQRRSHSVLFPAWPVPVLTAMLPTFWLVTRRRRINTCSVCGYDLRATPDRCPECGRAVTTKGAMPVS